MTGEEWDTHYWVIKDDLIREGVAEDNAHAIAELECVEQFGPHPEDVAS